MEKDRGRKRKAVDQIEKVEEPPTKVAFPHVSNATTCAKQRTAMSKTSTIAQPGTVRRRSIGSYTDLLPLLLRTEEKERSEAAAASEKERRLELEVNTHVEVVDEVQLLEAQGDDD